MFVDSFSNQLQHDARGGDNYIIIAPSPWQVYYMPVCTELAVRVQELCESRGGCPGLSVLMVSVDVKQH